MTRTGLVVFVLVIGGAACSEEGSPKVATLASAAGDVDQSEQDAPSTWQAAEVGHVFHVGDGVRTGEDAKARVELLPAGALILGENSRVRFGPEDRLVGLEVGAAEIESGPDGVAIATAVGQARLEPSSRVRVRTVDGQLRFEVVVGQAIIESDDGERETLSRGESALVGVAGSITEAENLTDPVTPSEVEGRADAATMSTGEVDAMPASAPISIRVNGRGARLSDGEGGTWRRIRPGKSQLAAGTRVSLPAGATMRVTRGHEQATVRGRAEVVVGPANGALISAVRGRASVSASRTDVRIEVPGGVIIARRRERGISRAAIRVGKSGTEVEAETGRIDIETAAGDETLVIGERARVARGGGIRVKNRAPRVADFSIPAGESPVVHVLRPPVAIRVRFGDACRDGGIVEVARTRRGLRDPELSSRGQRAAIIAAPRGSRRYRVRCLERGKPTDAVAARGRIVVRRDSGARKLPKRAPRSELDADGRRYTVLYQNRLPQITFRWSRPAAADLALHIRSKSGKVRVIPAPTASHVARSGSLAEGEYIFWFQATSDADIRSPKTQLVIRFDNAARTAYVREPRIRDKWSPQKIEVSGVTLEGYRVSANGERLAVDGERRFSGTVSLPRGERALAIRFAHSSRGVHYYLRRSGGP